jgi:hypothetical protein
VIGLVIAGHEKAYYIEDVQEVGVLNDEIGGLPVLVWARETNFPAYIRVANERMLTFHSEGDRLVDEETGSVWDVSRGLAIDGPLKGVSLQSVPSMSSYDWAWHDFYPDAEIYQP